MIAWIKILVPLLTGVFLCLSLPRQLPAQATTAQVVGAVNNASGAAVPNAIVTVTNVTTSLSRETKTNMAGNYEFSFLPIGL